MKQKQFLSKLNQQARALWALLPSEQQKQLHVAFSALDRNNDGSVTLQELERFCASAKLPLKTFQQLYQAYDLNRDGLLTFDEGLPLLFAWLVYCIPTCSMCQNLVMNKKYYSCIQCEATGDDFVVCKDCHKLGRHGHMHTNFNKQVTLIAKPHKSPLMTSRSKPTAACECCGLQHSLSASGVLGGYFPHMIESDGKWYCEFCAVWICALCQTQHLDTEHPREGQWSKAFICQPCTEGDLSGEHTLQILDVDSVSQKAQTECSCKTCSFKARHGLTKVLSLPGHDTVKLDFIDVPNESMPSKFASFSDLDIQTRDQGSRAIPAGAAALYVAGGSAVILSEMLEGVSKALLLFAVVAT